MKRGIGGDLVRILLFLHAWTRESFALKRFLKLSGLRAMSLRLLRRKGFSGESGPLFILGTGSSIEDLSAEQWREIQSGTTIGVNAWLIHPFVPNAYAYETVVDRDSDHARLLIQFDRPELRLCRPPILLLRPKSGVVLEQLQELGQETYEDILVYGRVNPLHGSRRLLRTQIILGYLLNRLTRSRVFLDSGATIVRLAFMGWLLGFQKIVFVGVDLIDTKYFWEVNPTYLRLRGIDTYRSAQTGTIHETMSTQKRPFSVQEMILEMSSVAKKLSRTQFLVASERSALASGLAVWNA